MQQPAPYSRPFAQTTPVARRDALKSGLAAIAATVLAQPVSASPVPAEGPDARRSSPKRYEMKKSINLWAFPYPERMNLEECLRLA